MVGVPLGRSGTGRRTLGEVRDGLGDQRVTRPVQDFPEGHPTLGLSRAAPCVSRSSQRVLDPSRT